MRFPYLLAIILSLLCTAALADSYVNVQNPTGVWDSTTGSLYALGIPGQGQTGQTIIPSAATANTWSGSNNFTGTFKIGGTTETFPTSGLIVGTTDSQTLTNKTLTAPTVNGVVGGTTTSQTITGLTLGSTTLLATNVGLTNGAASNAGTLTNAPAAGNPTKWIPINDNGTTRYIPAW